MLTTAGTLSYNTDTIDTSFRLRQASAAIVLCMTVMFYPIWFATKTVRNMTKQGIILLIISSLASLIIAVFLLVTSIPTYYISVNQQEFWYYIFQFLPITIALFSWTILHPKRSLLPTHERQEIVKRETLALVCNTDVI
jgi:cytochrome bd-type quinol oxidase subunit 2